MAAALVVGVMFVGACGDSDEGATPATTVPDDGGDAAATTAADPVTTTTPGATTAETGSEDSSGEETSAGDGFEELLGDLDQPCTVIDATEITAIIGGDVVADDTFPTDCFYDPPDAGSGPSVHTSTLAIPEDQCAALLQTEAILPGETVEPATGYGDHASIIRGTASVQFSVCSPDVIFDVIVFGRETDDQDDLARMANEVLDLLVSRT